MAFFSFLEGIDALIMTALVGFLFMDIFRRRQLSTQEMLNPRKRRWSDFLFAAAIIAPSVILHELGHKFVAMGFGQAATFHGACSIQPGTGGLFNLPCILMIVAIGLKLAGSNLLFFIPAYVSISGSASALEHALIAFAGPGINLLLWAIPAAYIRYARGFSRLATNTQHGLVLLSRINLFLFVFNILPIPGFDGSHILRNLIAAF